MVVVTEGTGPLVPVEQSGDEPQMLARDIRGVPIVVAADRVRAGQAAIDRFDLDGGVDPGRWVSAPAAGANR